MRLTTTGSKIAYLLCCILISAIMQEILSRLGLTPPHIPGWVVGLITLPVSVGSVVLAVRTFRGKGEPIAPPRAWWRMTGGPRSGFVMAAVTGSTLILLIPHDQRSVQPLILSVALSALVAIAYLNSSIRLVRISRRSRLMRAAPSHRGS